MKRYTKCTTYTCSLHPTMYCIYILLCSTCKYYIGLTVYLTRHRGYTNLITRLLELPKPHQTASTRFGTYITNHNLSRFRFLRVLYCNTRSAIPAIAGLLVLGKDAACINRASPTCPTSTPTHPQLDRRR